jgi:hypothetical protein
MESIKPSNPAAMRIVFGYDGKSRLFMSFFADSKDNSLYFRIYRGGDQSDVVRIQLPEPDTAVLEEEISALEAELVRLKGTKGNHHHSGERNAASSRKGPNFSILSVAPAHPAKMAESPSLDSKRDIHFALQGDVRPFVVNFIAHRKSSPEMPIIEGGDLMGGSFMQCEFDNMAFDLLISMSQIGKTAETERVNWPPFPVVLKRIGQNEARRSREIP